ncbi:MAG: cache domain-containing protein, partial [Pseudomonadota bacterium]|nr:cache domain-containing protein [Pseudomonadota bacterium]
MSNMLSQLKGQSFNGIAAKLTILLLLVGLVPALVVFGVFKWSEAALKKDTEHNLENLAVHIGQTIDRNLFERYGDVQAFGLNVAAFDQANWNSNDPANPLVHAMDGYMTGYGIYRLMLLLDLSGKVVAVNSVDAKGKPIGTSQLLGANFAGEEWFAAAAQGRFLEGRNGLTGTAVAEAQFSPVVAKLYGDDGFVLPFSAPVKDAAGKAVAVWVNFADFGLVEEIYGEIYAEMEKEGRAHAELTLLDKSGRVLVDYDPHGQKSKEYRRNPNIIGKFNLAEKLEVAKRAVAGETGVEAALQARKNVWQEAAFAHTRGAYDYPGLGWSVLVR